MTSETKSYLNEANCDRLISALETEAASKMFDMGHYWFQPKGAKAPREAFETGGDCGTTACMAGMAAIIDPEFFGIFDTWNILEDFTKWLDISADNGFDLTHPNLTLWHSVEHDSTVHAINLLRAFKSGGYEAAKAVADKQRDDNRN